MRHSLTLVFALTSHAIPAGAAEAPAPSRILPQSSRDERWERSSLGMDAVSTHLKEKTRENFTASSLGLDFSYEQHAHGAFWGSLHLGLENWRTKAAAAGGGGQSFFPIRITSEILGEAPLWLLPGGQALSFFRPFVTGGLGYMTFSSTEGTEKSVLRALRGEGIGMLGAGVRLAWNDTAALKVTWKAWRGLETSRIRNHTLAIGFQFGDLSRR